MLELDHLTRRFGDVVALDEVTFTVPAGSMFGFVGSNGSGKTTAMRIVMGVDDPDSGEVRWRGHRIDRSMRTAFGYMPEERGLYPKTPADRQLTYLGRLRGMSAVEAAAASHRWLTRLGLGRRAGDRVEQLSLGNQQRVQLAAALVHDPELLVLDEPFSGLDPTGVDALAEILLERCAAGVPVLFSSHQLDLVERLCDSIAIIDDGHVVAQGRVEDLRHQNGQAVWRVRVRGSSDVGAALAGVPGARIVGHDHEGVLVHLDPGTDDQLLLDAARRVGPVDHFGPIRPTLAQLYREVVDRVDAAQSAVVHGEGSVA